MPVVSQRNAIFMENEVNGIHVAEEIIEAFAGLDREQGEALGLEISLKMAREALPLCGRFLSDDAVQPGGADGAADRPAEDRTIAGTIKSN